MGKIKKKLKLQKVFAIIMAAIFVLALPGANAKAADISTGNETATLTINNLENGVTVKAYKIIEVTWNGTAQQPKNPMYKWVNDVATYLKGAGATDYGQYIGTNGEVQGFDTASVADQKKVLEAINDNVKTLSVASQGTASSDSVTMSLGMGSYLLVATPASGTDIYQVTSVNMRPEFSASKWVLKDQTVNMKSGTSLTKDVDEHIVNTGDTVTYTVKTRIPTYASGTADNTFSIIDTFTDGLSYVQNSLKVDNNSVSGVATVTYDSTDRKLTVAFLKDYINANQGEEITVTYQMTVDVAGFNGSKIPLVNDAYAAYHDPTTNESGETAHDKESVYTYIIDVTKKGENNALLAGAEFALYRKDDMSNALKFTGSAGTYTYDANGTGTTTTLTTGTNGKLLIQGLEDGNYVLRETKAPDGYVLPANTDLTITISAPQDGGEMETTSTVSGEILGGTPQVTDYTLAFDVVNEKDVFKLPQTGGAGTLAFTVGGILLMAGAVLFLVVSRKKHK